MYFLIELQHTCNIVTNSLELQPHVVQQLPPSHRGMVLCRPPYEIMSKTTHIGVDGPAVIVLHCDMGRAIHVHGSHLHVSPLQYFTPLLRYASKQRSWVIMVREIL
jgi:hypothetical protein